MKVIEAWLRAGGGRGVMLTLHPKEGWHADAVVPDDDWPPTVSCSGGEEGSGRRSSEEALESLDQALSDEARALAKVDRIVP